MYEIGNTIVMKKIKYYLPNRDTFHFLTAVEPKMEESFV